MLECFKRKFLCLYLIAGLLLAIPSKSMALDPKVKALGMVALYGTIGGALLGTASLAFGTRPRAIFQGASIGLYAGLIFGSYIVITHSMKKNNPDQERYQYPSEYEEALSPQTGQVIVARSSNEFRYQEFSYFEGETARWQGQQPNTGQARFSLQFLNMSF